MNSQRNLLRADFLDAERESRQPRSAKKVLGLLLVAVAPLLALLNGRALGATFYNVTDLGLFQNSTTYGLGINNSGQVVATDFTTGEGYRTEANQPINPATDNLGALSGAYILARSINDNGQIVGYATITGGSNHAFATEANQPINPATDDLGTLGGTNSDAFGINNSGQVVGYAQNSGGVYDAFRYSNGVMTDLGSFGGPSSVASVATGINNSGQIAGYSLTSGSAQNAFRTVPNQPITPADDLGTLGGTNSMAYAINDSGQVVGTAQNSSGVYDAFLYSNGAMIDLGTLAGLNSEAQGINAIGQVVGMVETTSFTKDAFLYSDGIMTDLNTLIEPDSGWILEVAESINDSGEISGYGYNSSGQEDAFLLTPVPEPSTVALFVIGTIGLAGCGWRRRQTAWGAR